MSYGDNNAATMEALRDENRLLEESLDNALQWRLKAENYSGLLQSYNTVISQADDADRRFHVEKKRADALQQELDETVKDLEFVLEDDDSKIELRGQVYKLERERQRQDCHISVLRQENAKRRMENEGLQATLDDTSRELYRYNEEISELRGEPFTGPNAVRGRIKQLEEENARLEADNGRLEARASQARRDLEKVRDSL